MSHKISQKKFDEYKVRFLEKNNSKALSAKATTDAKLFIKGEKVTFKREEVLEMLKEPGDLQIWNGAKEDGQFVPILKTAGGATILEKPVCC